MVLDNSEIDETAYTISIDAASADMTRGISAHDRTLTAVHRLRHHLQLPFPDELGMLFLSKQGSKGVMERRGHMEVAIEFCKLAGKRPAGAIAESITDGETVGVKSESETREAGIMTRDGCLRFGKDWDITICTIEDLVECVEAKKSVNG